ncbi:MAG: peptidoglycan editing factor PgeF [Thermodesulfobacteriota bacterium]
MLLYPIFPAESVIHATFRRHGGVSSAPWDSLNVGLACGDATANVVENRRRVKERLGLDLLVSARQVHGDRVVAVRQTPAADIEIPDCDGLVTDHPGLGLMIQQADCQAVLLHDPQRPAVGICHSGWRGSVADIIGGTVAAMTREFGSTPATLRAAISPSLGPCCAEFVNHRLELPDHFRKYRRGAAHFDFWTISRDQLVGAGLRPEHIEIAGVCTRCSPDYFSYRRDRVTGRFASVIGIRTQAVGSEQ